MGDAVTPAQFEKEFIERCGKSFNETKVLFFHEARSGQTVVKYASGNKLLGVRMYRESYSMDHWINHFKTLLKTGKFPEFSYWQIYKTRKDIGGITKVCMHLKKKEWDIFSPQFHAYMATIRNLEGMSGVGFRQMEMPL